MICLHCLVKSVVEKWCRLSREPGPEGVAVDITEIAVPLIEVIADFSAALTPTDRASLASQLHTVLDMALDAGPSPIAGRPATTTSH